MPSLPDLSRVLPSAVGEIPKEDGLLDFGDSIRRRLGTVDQIGAQQNNYANQQATNQQNQLAAQQTAAMQRAQQQSQSTANTNGQYSGMGPIPNDGTLRGRLVAEAATFSGTPYVWGGSKPGGFDCSGLVQYAYGQMGVSMPRVSQQQAQQGRVTPINQLKPGDLVAWGSSPATAHHIAIYAGNGQVWEAPHSGASVRLRPIGNWSGDKEAFGVALNIP